MHRAVRDCKTTGLLTKGRRTTRRRSFVIGNCSMVIAHFRGGPVRCGREWATKIFFGYYGLPWVTVGYRRRGRGGPTGLRTTGLLTTDQGTKGRCLEKIFRFNQV